MVSTRHNRVSPWEIEPSGSVSPSNNFNAGGLKRNRISLPSSKLEFPVPRKSVRILWASFLGCPTAYNFADVFMFCWQMGLEHQTLVSH